MRPKSFPKWLKIRTPSMILTSLGHWRNSKVSIDRRQKLLQRSNALAAAGNQRLPQQTRAKYQKAADHLGLSLGLEDALDQKNQQPVFQSQLPSPSYLPQPSPEAPPNQLQESSKELQPVPNLLA